MPVKVNSFRSDFDPEIFWGITLISNGTQHYIVDISVREFLPVVTLASDGTFELNLRDEYRFEWKDDPIDFYFTDKTDGKVYNFNYTDGSEKKSVDLDLLYSLLESNTPIVLTEEQ